MKEKIKVGIIDDDESKIVNIITNLLKDVSSILGDNSLISHDKKNQYEKYEIVPIKLKLVANMDEILNEIVEENVNILIIDYKLNSLSNINFSGVDLAKKVNDSIIDFPVFLLTSFEEDLYNKEIFNSYQVFDYSRYMSESNETLELNYKIIKQVLIYRKQIESWEKRLLELIEYAGTSSNVDDEIMELDRKLSSSIFGNRVLSNRTKKIVCSDKMSELLDKLEEIIKQYD